jgi:hypothetical protein
MAELTQNIKVEEHDVYSLLSFTNFVQVEQFPDLERRTVLSNEPRQYATRGHPWRIAKCLDSLANVCVAERREVLATALRYGNVKNRKTLEIIIAGHDDVSGRTISHLEQIWGLLRRISETARQKNQAQLASPYPRPEVWS